VPLPEIMACAAQYNARVHELRRLNFQIENRIETVNGVRRSAFRLDLAPINTCGVMTETAHGDGYSLFGDLSVEHNDQG
jgi:hypothetical protein